MDGMTNQGGGIYYYVHVYLMLFPLCGLRVIYGEEILAGFRHPFARPLVTHPMC